MNATSKNALGKKLALAVLVPIAVLVACELTLRAVGFGHPLTFFVRDDRPGYVRTNPAFT